MPDCRAQAEYRATIERSLPLAEAAELAFRRIVAGAPDPALLTATLAMAMLEEASRLDQDRLQTVLRSCGWHAERVH